MATLAQIQTFALGNPDLKQRFAASRIQAVWDILAETNPSAQRVAWRLKVLNDQTKDLDREYLWFLSHPNIQNGSALALTTAGEAALNAATKSFVDAWAAVA